MKRTTKGLVWAYAIGLSLLLIMRDLWGISISKYIYLVYIVAIMAMAPYEAVIHMTCFTLPLVCGLPGTYVMPCIWMLLVIKRKSVNIWQLMLLAFPIVWEMLAALWYPAFNVPSIVQYTFFAGVMFFLIHDDRELNYLNCVKMYLMGSILLCATIIVAGLMTAPADWLEQFALGQFRFGSVASGNEEGMSLLLNANSLAYYSIVAVFCAVLLAERTKKAGYIVLAIFVAFAGFLSLSRSWLLVMAICLLLYILSKLRKPKQFLTLFAVLAIVSIVLSLYLKSQPELLAGFEVRFQEDDLESGNGRMDILKIYMEAFFSDIRYMFLGTGVTQYHAVVGLQGSMHNGTQQILVCCGVVGFVIYIIGLIKPILQARDQRKIRMVYWLPLLSVVLFVQTIQFLNPMMLMLPYVVGVYALRIPDKQQ